MSAGITRIVVVVLLAGGWAGTVTAQTPDTRGDTSPRDATALVSRGRIRLHLAGAERILAAAKAHATDKGWKVNIAVVDDGGHLLAFARLDGARPASAPTAITKAVTAATTRAPSGPAGPSGQPVDIHLNVALQNAASASGGTLTTLYGGVPIELEGQVIGAVGVGGATGEQDAEVARAGIAAFVEAVTTR